MYNIYFLHKTEGYSTEYYIKKGVRKTFPSFKAAQKYCTKNNLEGYSPVEFVAYERFSKFTGNETYTTSVAEHIALILSEEGVRAKGEFLYDTEYNVVRHTPLGEKPAHNKGDKTMVTECYLRIERDV